MEPPDGCPAEVYDIMRQVLNFKYYIFIRHVTVCIILYHILIGCYSLTGMGFTARKETEFSRYKSNARPIES